MKTGDSTFNPAVILENLKIIERKRLGPVFALSWPRIITGFARMSKVTADFAMVGIAESTAALAGMSFALAYWQIGVAFSLGLSGGTISLVAQSFGRKNTEQAGRVIRQSVWLALLFSTPLIVIYSLFAEPLIHLLGAEMEAVSHGGLYLRFLMPGLIFEFFNHIASRAFAGIGDTVTPMIFRGAGAVANIAINAVLIFGFNLGVTGAAIGTVAAGMIITLCFAWSLLGRGSHRKKEIPLCLNFEKPLWDSVLNRQLLRISIPLMLQGLVRSFIRFPFLAVASIFGSITVAAYEIGLRVRNLTNSLSWGYSMAASSLVGQKLGADDEKEAGEFGRDIIRLAFISYLIIASAVFVFAGQISLLFTDNPEAIPLTQVFIMVASISAIGQGLDGTATGALTGSGDTKWPFYGKVIGLYLFAMPLALLGRFTPLGLTALYGALISETIIPAAFTLYRFHTGAWKQVSRSFRT